MPLFPSCNNFYKFHGTCILFSRYCYFNLWLGSLEEYLNVKYCEDYVYKRSSLFIHEYLCEHVDPLFFYYICKQPTFSKFLKSGFIKYLNLEFLQLLYKNCLSNSVNSEETIKGFVDNYFSSKIKGKLEKDLLTCVLKCISTSTPNSLREFGGSFDSSFKHLNIYNAKNINLAVRILGLPTYPVGESKDSLTKLNKSEGFYFKSTKKRVTAIKSNSLLSLLANKSFFGDSNFIENNCYFCGCVGSNIILSKSHLKKKYTVPCGKKNQKLLDSRINNTFGLFKQITINFNAC